MRVPSAEAVRAMQTALAAEHAAVWVYGLASAFLTDDRARLRERAVRTHRALRDGLERRLLAAGADPVAAEPAYRVPGPVGDAAAAIRVLVRAETDAAAAWRAVVERSPPDSELRGAAADALSAAAVWASRWRAEAGIDPVTVAFPGAPNTRG